MVTEEELGLLLQLVAAHPDAAASLWHLGTWTDELGRQFDPGKLEADANACQVCF